MRSVHGIFVAHGDMWYGMCKEINQTEKMRGSMRGVVVALEIIIVELITVPLIFTVVLHKL